MSVCIRKFLSHPIEDENPFLVDHLLDVAQTAKNIFAQTCFKNYEIAFYSGLLHDVGKINPIYQNIFYEPKNRKKTEDLELKIYVKEHSRFSAWIADKLLEKIDLNYETIDKILILIYGHHTTIRKNLGDFSKTKNFIASQNAISSALNDFFSQSSTKSDFSKLNWVSCKEKFIRPIKFDVNLKSKNSPDDFLEMSCAFSCLLQADRGSFHKWSIPNFDLKLNTESQIHPSLLGKIRTDFQTQVEKNFDDSDAISIINAPTGIGKTKVFLDIINKYSNNKNIERIFYFSPLLALTEDFEKKISEVIPKNKKKQYGEDILIYNHLFSGSLEEKNQENEIRHSNLWIFENESFNKKFIITTTQRLLMTIYSNKTRDKMKMVSFRNSILIVDEVQTIPKSILSNLKEIFKKMNQYMGTKFILVSATIPHEINDVKRIELPKNILNDYLIKTKKQISIQQFNAYTIPICKTLIMANTRKKAITKHSEVIQAHPNKQIFYLSTGIRKKDRSDIIKKLSKESDYVLVATQVVEAGVDISFSHVFREEAPLDNIIQVMGRLNREGENQDARLIIYPTDGKSIPYSPLEFQVTQEKIKKIKNSVELYDILGEYYSEIYEQNLSNQNDTQKLERLVERMDFDAVWKFVGNMIFQEDNRDTVFIPDSKDYEFVRKNLLDGTSKKNFKAFGKLTATLPISIYKLKEREGKNLFDEELMEKNILLPQKQYLEKIYDKNTGLDKWLTE